MSSKIQQNGAIKNYVTNISNTGKETTDNSIPRNSQKKQARDKKQNNDVDNYQAGIDQNELNYNYLKSAKILSLKSNITQSKGDFDEVNQEEDKTEWQNNRINQADNSNTQRIVSHQTQPTQDKYTIDQATPKLMPINHANNHPEIQNSFKESVAKLENTNKVENDIQIKKQNDQKGKQIANSNINNNQKECQINISPSPTLQILQLNSQPVPKPNLQKTISIPPQSSSLALNQSHKLGNEQQSNLSNNRSSASYQLVPIMQGASVSSTINTEEKSHKFNGLDEERMIIEIIYSGLVSELKHFVMKDRSLNYLREFEHLSSIDEKVSPLIIAVFCGNIDHVRGLFNSKAKIDVNFPSLNNKLSPLMVSCMKGQFEICQYLVAKGADIHQQSIDGLTPFCFCFARLEEDKNYFENKNLCMKMALFLLANGSNINQIVDKYSKNTLLMQFCSIQGELSETEKENNLSMIKFLVCNGAGVFLKNANSQDCYDLIQNNPYKAEVIQIFESFENVMFAYPKAQIDIQVYSKQQQLFQSQNIEKLQIKQSRKLNHPHILTTQSTIQQMHSVHMNISNSNSYNQNSSNPLFNTTNNSCSMGQINNSMNNIQGSGQLINFNTMYGSGANYNPYHSSSNNNNHSPNNHKSQSFLQIKQAKSLSKYHQGDVQIEGTEDKNKQCCSFFV